MHSHTPTMPAIQVRQINRQNKAPKACMHHHRQHHQERGPTLLLRSFIHSFVRSLNVYFWCETVCSKIQSQYFDTQNRVKCDREYNDRETEWKEERRRAEMKESIHE